LKILENDGSTLLYEVLEPKWSVADVHQRHHDRIAKALGVTVGDRDGLEWEDAELDPRVSGERGTYRRLTAEVVNERWFVLPSEQREQLAEELTSDYRERQGLNRNDAKPEARVLRRRTLEQLADDYGIPTNDTVPWRRLVVEAIEAAQPQGVVA
jgi:hypothetical protein